MREIPKILVVDDDRANVKFVQDSLRDERYEVDSAADGVAGLDKIKQDPPDLLLLDVMMPRMNGFELCRIVKSMSGENFIPVILLTVKGDVDSKVQGLKIGADDYLPKPFDPMELKARISSMLRIKQLQDRITEKKQELETLSVTDGLTGLYNHRFLQQRLADEFNRAKRYNDPLSCVMLDIDHFKKLNDEYGHPFGDEVLKQIAKILTDNARTIDVVTRYGGEEFLLILPQTHFTGSLALAERIWRAIREHPFNAGGITTQLTVSMGISFYPNKNVYDQVQLIAYADEALYKAKREGRNRICLYQHQTYFFEPDGPGPKL